MRKKLLTLTALCATVLLLLSGCGGKETNQGSVPPRDSSSLACLWNGDQQIALGMTREEVLEHFMDSETAVDGCLLEEPGVEPIEGQETSNVFQYGRGQDRIFVTYHQDVVVGISTYNLNVSEGNEPFSWETAAGITDGSDTEALTGCYPAGQVIEIAENVLQPVKMFQALNDEGGLTCSLDEEGRVIALFLTTPERFVNYGS